MVDKPKKTKAKGKGKFKKGKGKKTKIPINVFGGSSKMIKMEYVANVILTTGANPTGLLGSGQLSFRLNNVNLPFIGQTSGFSLPQGFSQAAEAYRYFKVLGVKITAEAHDPSENCQVAMMAVSSGDTIDLQGYNISQSDMRKDCSVKPLSNTGAQKAIFKRYIKIHQIEGIKTAQFDGDFSLYAFLFNKTVSTAETDESGTTGELIKKRVPKVHFAVCSNDTQTDAVSCRMKIKMEYYTYCYGKKALATTTST